LIAGHRHTCALFTTGQVKCWGGNNEGELGLGDTNNRGDNAGEMGANLPLVDLGPGTVVNQIVVGGSHSCALLSTGQVKCWGRSNAGQLGYGDTNSRGNAVNQMGTNLPTVSLGTGRTAKAITAGTSHTCALLDNSFVKCWGLNNVGQLGLGNTTNHGIVAGDMGDSLPAVSLGQNVQSVSAGNDYTCVVLADNSVKCWGYNADGELGVGATDNRGDGPGEMGNALPAVNLGTALSASAVVVGGANACARITDGRLKCWGYNFDGELGIETTANHGDTPTNMGDNLPFTNLGSGRTVKQLSAGIGSHTCALLDNNALKCWGINGSGQLGQGNMIGKGSKVGDMGDNLAPIDLGSANVVGAVSAGGATTCALLMNGEVKCWGYDADGEEGYGDTSIRGDATGEMGNALPFVDLGP
jgi:alpha-tubulin suppressor-like RCC1 family protein